jgi:7-keto-8-aminopelargonate synthetase-like enzyme
VSISEGSVVRTTGKPPWLSGSVLNYVRQDGTCLRQRTGRYHDWVLGRAANGVVPFQRTSERKIGREVWIGSDNLCATLNFSSQDYLGLAQDPRMAEEAMRGVANFGVHSAGSPAFCGSTRALRGLEDRISDAIGTDQAVVYPTGWAAGYGVPVALIRGGDLVLMDALSHNCIQEGARASGGELRKFRHNDLAELESLLLSARAADATRGIFVLVESLYSMDSDSPDLGALLDLCERYEAISILDVAHDFGSMGEHGRGLLDTVPGRLPDVVLGSFSKTFAANGGFAAAKPEVVNYLRYYSPTNLFSNAISPMQTYVADKAFEITFSEEGTALRNTLMERVKHLRASMSDIGFQVHGDQSPICPVFVGDEALARLTSKHVFELGMAANLVEFPAVPRGKARFRFQLMANHEPEDLDRAAAIMLEARHRAETELAGLTHEALTQRTPA